MRRVAPFFGARGSLQRRYVVATAIFAVLVLGIILLFGHLISTSLSRQYISDMLVSGREEAERIAQTLGPEDGEDMQVVTRRREELVRTLAGLPQRRILESMEVTDASGEVVFTSDFRTMETLPDEMVSHLELSDELSDPSVRETETSYQISVPLGEVGEMVLNISKARVAERAIKLRQELIRQSVMLAGLTGATLVVAFVFNWGLVQRFRRVEAERQRAAELAGLGALAANLAHEIRNPLNSINLNLELLEEDLAAAGRHPQESLACTRQEVARLATLVSDFLTYARPSPPELTALPVARLLHQVSDFFKGEAKARGIQLRVQRGLPDVDVVGDPGQLRQVMLNLVLNGLQAVTDLGVERRVVELGAGIAGETVEITVTDRGDGIPNDQLEQVREAFFTRRRGGTGLGLAIVERIVSAHQGRLELRNLNPRGFASVLVLPISPRGGKMGAALGSD